MPLWAHHTDFLVPIVTGKLTVILKAQQNRHLPVPGWAVVYIKIMIAFDQENLTQPTFIEEQVGMTAIIPRERFMAISRGETAETKRIPPSDQKSDQKVLECVRQKPHVTIGELMETLNMSELGIKKIIRKLKTSGRLRRIGADNSGSWKIIGKK